MKQILLTAVFGVLAVGVGFGVMVAADRYGWISSPGTTAANRSSSNQCEHLIDAARCPFCNPGLIESMGWCSGHGVPEAMCTRCSPSLIPAFKAQNDWCGAHGVPESLCRECGADPETRFASLRSGSEQSIRVEPEAGSAELLRAARPPSATCDKRLLTVQLASADVARRAGIKVEGVRVQSIDDVVMGTAQVRFDGNRYVHLASRAPGTVAEVIADFGAWVEAGDVLAVIDSADVGMAKAAYLQALSLVELWTRHYDRERSLLEKNVGTVRETLDAESKLAESRVELSLARQRLYNLGLSNDDLEAMVQHGETSTALAIRAPFGGMVTNRQAVIGEVITTSQPLYSIADTSMMWVMIDVNEGEHIRLQTGSVVQVSLDALPGRIFDGTLTWISPEVDPRTRTIQARAEISNPDGMLRANMFGTAQIVVASYENAILVPASAVQWDGCCNVVFVRHTDTVYQPYPVTLGPAHGDHYIVLDGLPSSESIVTQGSFLLKTEILKGNIGAGCCEVDPGANS